MKTTREFIRRTLPGHFIAVTVKLLLMFVGVATYISRNPIVVMGTVVMVLGLFVADQTTHISVHHDEGALPTFLERSMEAHPQLWYYFGIFIAELGFALIVPRP